MKGATWDPYNFFIREIVDENWRFLFIFKARAKTSIWAIAPQVDSTSLRDSSTVTLARAHLTNTHLRQFDYLRRHKDIFIATMSQSTLLAASPGKYLPLHWHADWMHRATFNSCNWSGHSILFDEEFSRLRLANDGSKPKSSILAISPRIHLIVAGQNEDVADTTWHHDNFGAEAGEVDDCRPRDDWHLGLNDWIFFGTFWTCAHVKLIASSVTVFFLFVSYWINNRQLLVKREQLCVTLSIHE